EGLRQRSAEVTVALPTAVALYIFNQKRIALAEIEGRHKFRAVFQPDDTMGLSTYRIVRSVPKTADVRPERAPQPQEAGNGRREPQADHQIERLSEEPEVPAVAEPVAATVSDGGAAAEPGAEPRPSEARDSEERGGEDRAGEDREGQGERRGRRRGRRGGRRRRGRHREDEGAPAEGNGEPPRESTLGPFGQESEGPAQAIADQPAGEPSSEHFEEREPARA